MSTPNYNVSANAPPTNTPMHTRSSVDQAMEAHSDQGLCTLAWISFFWWMYGIIAPGYNVSGTFTTADAKTITVENGIITSIV